VSTVVYCSTSSYANDSFLLDVVPPSPCRGQVQLKPVGVVDCDTRHSYRGTREFQQTDHGSEGVLHNTDTSRSPPPLPPSIRSRTVTDCSRIVLVDRSTAPVESSSPVFQAPPPVLRRIIDESSLPKVGYFADDATRLTSSRSQRQYSGTAADRSQSTSDDNDEENFEDGPGITCPQTPAPSVPDRRHGTPAMLVANGMINLRAPRLRQSNDRQSVSVSRQSVEKRPSQCSVDSSFVPDSSQYVETDRLPNSPRRPATAIPRCGDYQNSLSSSSKKVPVSCESAPSVPDELSLSSSSLHRLHSSPPAPHISSANQVFTCSGCLTG